MRVIHPHRHGKDGGADSAPPDGPTDSVRPEPEPAASQNLRGRRVSRRDTFPQVTRSRRIGGTGRDGHERNRCTPVPVSHRGRQRSPLTRGEIVRHGARLRKPAAGHCGHELRGEPSRERVRGTSVCERTVTKRFRHRAQARASCPHRCFGWNPALSDSRGDGGLAGSAALRAAADAYPLRRDLGVREHGAVRGERAHGECVGQAID